MILEFQLKTWIAFFEFSLPTTDSQIILYRSSQSANMNWHKLVCTLLFLDDKNNQCIFFFVQSFSWYTSWYTYFSHTKLHPPTSVTQIKSCADVLTHCKNSFKWTKHQELITKYFCTPWKENGRKFELHPNQEMPEKSMCWVSPNHAHHAESHFRRFYCILWFRC